LARGTAGFTLLEILVVLVLLAIISAVGASRISGNFDKRAMQQATGELSSMLRRARSRAIVSNEPVAVRVDVDPPSFSIPSERPYKVSDRLKLTLFTAVTDRLAANVGEIRFFPDGSSTGGEVTLEGANARHFVQVDWLTGRVAVYQQ